MKKIVTLLAIWSLLWKAQTTPVVRIVTVTKGVIIPATRAVIAPGGSVMLECDAMGATSSITWKRNNTVLENSQDIVINSDGNMLTVMQFSSDLEGNYTCVASYEAGFLSSRAAVLILPVFHVNLFSMDTSSPHEVVITEGEPTTIECGTIQSNFPANLEWKILLGSSSFSLQPMDNAVSGVNHSLFLTNPRLSDNGNVYSCHITNRTSSRFLVGYIRIRVQASTLPPSSPSILVRPRDISAPAGQNVDFECIPGRSDSIARWTYPPGESIRINSYKLSIFNVTNTNVGTYTCEIDGVGTFSANMTLKDPPPLTSTLPSNVSLIYGDPLSLNCSTPPNPLAMWEWYHNGNRIPGETGPTLQVSSSTLQESGSYQCLITNSAGYNQGIGVVNVQIVPANFLVTLPEAQLAYLRKPFNMTVSACGAPPPVYEWFEDGVRIEAMEAFDVSTEGTLRIHNVSQDLVGAYSCRVRNYLPNGSIVGEQVAETILSAIEPTVIVQQPTAPIFKAEINSTIYFPCETEYATDAVVTYAWTKDGRPFVSDKMRFVRSDLELGDILIEGVDYSDQGEYQCHAHTEYNHLIGPITSTQATQLHIIDIPVSPIIISLTSLSVTSFNIQWIFLGTINLLKQYNIEVQLASRQDNPWTSLLARSNNAITDVNVTSSSLKAYTLYNVRVTACHYGSMREGNISVPGVAQVLRTGEDVPKNSPRNVNIDGRNGVSYSVLVMSWEPPLNPRGKIINYIIEYRLMGEAEFTSFVTGGGNYTSYTINTNFPKYKRFEVRIAATTVIGSGPFSNISIGSTEVITLDELDGRPFQKSIGFVMIIVALVLIVMVSTAIAALIVKRIFRKKQAGRYHVRHSGFFGKGVTDVDDPKLSDSAVASYMGRNKRAFNSLSPVYSKSDEIDATLEAESSFGGTEYTYTTGTPQLSVSSSARLPHAPSYIDPPPFEEAVFKIKSRSQSTSSGYVHNELAKPVVDWDNEQGSSLHGHMTPPAHGVFSSNSNNVEYVYDESDNSIEKPGGSLSQDSVSDHTQYSHLAQLSTISPLHHHHHQLNMPHSANSTGSGTVPLTIGEMVYNRLKSQSPEVEGHQPLGYATNV